MWRDFQGKKVVLELTNGRMVYGEVKTVDQQFICVKTDEGVGTIRVDAVQIAWEAPERSLAQDHMEHIARLMRDNAKTNLVCYPDPFGCSGTYSCLPPHFCYPNFNCGPAGFSQGGGPPGCTSGYQCYGSFLGKVCYPPDFTTQGSPASGGHYEPWAGAEPISGQQFCRPFQFGPICRPFQFGQPCRPFQFGPPCGPFAFGPPCIPFQFGPPCGPFQFGPPCGPFAFGPCGPFQFGGSQCGVPGGFVCGGAQFIGVAPGTASTEKYSSSLKTSEVSAKEDGSKDGKKE